MPDSHDKRLTELSAWLAQSLPGFDGNLTPASGDASFRRYYRTLADGVPWIIMDAPPPTENVEAFVEVADLLRGAGVTVPKVHAADIARGYAVLSDLGNRPYLAALRSDNADRLYRDAIEALVRFQTAIDIQHCDRPAYGEALLRHELRLFREWFLERLVGLDLDAGEAALFEAVCAALIASGLEQPRVFVHRDYHSRNLMVCAAGNPGVLDFQDAVVGPIMYDLVSLLRDCYVAWPEARITRWLDDYVDQACRQGLLAEMDRPRFKRWFDLMGMQRHLKAIGIFARLNLRDGKTGYLGDIPRTLEYVTAVCELYPEFHDFGQLLRAVAGSKGARAVLA